MTLLLFDGSSKSSSSTIVTYTTCLAIFLVVASTSVSTENVTSKASSTTPSATPTEITIVNRRTSTISSSDYLAYQQQSYVEKHLPVEGNSPKKHRELVDKQRALEKTNRQRRQSFRKKVNGRDQSPGLLTLSFILVRDTINDTTTAYRNISRIVSDTIRQAAEPPPSTDDQQMMGSAQGSTPSTKPNPTASQNAISRLLGRNFRGLRRLFDSELRSAIGNTGQNVREFRQELTKSVLNSLRPSQIFTRGNGTKTNSV